jgi:nitrate/nitrite transporter NarK
MFELVIAFGTWYWTSKAWLWVSLILLMPIITWQFIKRMPNNSRLSRRKKRVYRK